MHTSHKAKRASRIGFGRSARKSTPASFSAERNRRTLANSVMPKRARERQRLSAIKRAAVAASARQSLNDIVLANARLETVVQPPKIRFRWSVVTLVFTVMATGCAQTVNQASLLAAQQVLQSWETLLCGGAQKTSSSSFARSTRSWVAQWEATNNLAFRPAVRHNLLFNIAGVRDDLRRFVHERVSAVQRSGESKRGGVPSELWQFSVKDFRRYVNTTYASQLKVLKRTGHRTEKTAGKIGWETARRWLHELGFEVKTSRSGLYVDGHEREDVVMARNEYVSKMSHVQRRVVKSWIPQLTMRDFGSDFTVKMQEAMGVELHIDNVTQQQERPVVVFYHDESACHSNDRFPKSVWVEKGSDLCGFVQKNAGVLLMVSAWFSHAGVEMYEKWVPRDDGYWNSTAMHSHTIKFMDYVTDKYPRCDLVFVLDNSSNHLAYADDALVAAKMNANEGGARTRKKGCEPELLKYRDGWVLKDGEKVPFSMMFDYTDSDGTTRRIAKGLKRIAVERGIKIEGMLKDDLVRVISQEPDFMEEVQILQGLIQSYPRCMLWFLPRYHCELNPIEHLWAEMKRQLRQVIDGTLVCLDQKIDAIMPRIGADYAAKCIMSSMRYVTAYLEASGNEGVEGAPPCTAADVMRKVMEEKKSHRRGAHSSRLDDDEIEEGSPLYELVAENIALNMHAWGLDDNDGVAPLAETERDRRHEHISKQRRANSAYIGSMRRRRVIDSDGDDDYEPRADGGGCSEPTALRQPTQGPARHKLTATSMRRTRRTSMMTTGVNGERQMTPMRLATAATTASTNRLLVLQQPVLVARRGHQRHHELEDDAYKRRIRSHSAWQVESSQLLHSMETRTKQAALTTTPLLMIAAPQPGSEQCPQLANAVPRRRRKLS